MLNRKYYPFERNNYYFGKLLTARDFEAEQRYFNDKRRLQNRLFGACGVLAGMDVIMADDTSLILQAGCALDSSGREIVVPETRVVKLSTIEGFAQLSTESAFLGISYDEQPADEAYSAMGAQGEGPSYNKVREQYRLTLLDENLAARLPSPTDSFVGRQVLYADREVEVVQRAPRFLVRGSNIAVITEIRRLAPGTGQYSFVYQLESPGLLNSAGAAATEIAVNNLKLSFGESQSVQTLLTPQSYLWGGASAALTATGFTIRKNDDTFTLKENLEMLLKPVDRDLTGHYLSSYYERPMDEELSGRYDERLWIARIRLIRQNNSVIIDAVDPPPYNQYCYNAQQLMALRDLQAYYPAAGSPLVPAGLPGSIAAAGSVSAERAERARGAVTGVFDFPIGMGAGQNEVLYSDEIMHGLGKGPVLVTAGVEYLCADEERSGDSEIILGDAGIFDSSSQAKEERMYKLSFAVKVLPERGTFVVGIRFFGATGLISLRVRWFAVRAEEPGRKNETRREGEKMILVHPDTLVLQPKGTAYISPSFINMPGEACNYRVIEAEGGSVDNNGVYTAPAKEGVYEIRVEAVSDPTVFTHVFAIVSAKKKEEPTA